MNLDLRLPMGLMFLITGAMMTIFGIFTWGSPIYEKIERGMNINFIWGLVMLILWDQHVPAKSAARDWLAKPVCQTRRDESRSHIATRKAAWRRAFGGLWHLY